MKTLIIFVVLLFIFCMQVLAQDNLRCPTISVIGPDDLINSFKNVKFTAKVEGVNLDKIEYLWTVSLGKVIEGQGTSTIKVSDEHQWEVDFINVTVEITGLPENCSKTASAKWYIFFGDTVQSSKINEISLRPPQIDKDKIDSLLIFLNNEPTAQGYIIELFKKTEPLKNVESKFSNIFAFLKVRKFSLEKLSLAIYFGEKNVTEFWITPKGAPLPPNIGEGTVYIHAKTYKQDLAKFFAS